MVSIFSKIMTATSVISAVSSATIWVPFVMYPTLRNKPYMAVVFLIAVSDFLNSLGSSVGLPSTSNDVCWFQGIMTNLFALTSVMWTVLISLMMQSIVISGKILQIRWYHHALFWGLPAFVTFIPLVDLTYGTPDGETWCWLIPKKGRVPSHNVLLVWKWVNFYGIIWASMLAVVVIFCWLWYEINFRVHSASTRVVQKVFQKLQLYPLVIFFSWIFPCIDDLYVSRSDYQFSSRIGEQVWGILIVALPCLQGFLTTAVFWWSNADIRRAMLAFFKDGKSLGPSLLSRSRFSSKVCPDDNPGVMDAAKEIINSLGAPAFRLGRSMKSLNMSRSNSYAQESHFDNLPEYNAESGRGDFQSQVSTVASSSKFFSISYSNKKLASHKQKPSSKSRSDSDAKGEVVSRNNSGSHGVDENGTTDTDTFGQMNVGARANRYGLNIPDRISEVSSSDRLSMSGPWTERKSFASSSGKAREELNHLDKDIDEISSFPVVSFPSSRSDVSAPPTQRQPLSSRNSFGIPLPESSKNAFGRAGPAPSSHLGPPVLVPRTLEPIVREGVNNKPVKVFVEIKPSLEPADLTHAFADQDDAVSNDGFPEQDDDSNDEEHNKFGRLSSGYQFYAQRGSWN